MGTDAGNPFNIVGPYGETLYPSPRSNPSKYRPSNPLRREMKHAVTQYSHSQMITDCTQLLCAIPVLSGAIRQMSEWAFAGDSWQPIHFGEDEDWGDLAADYLIQEVFPNCVRRTPAKSLIKAVQVSARGWLAQGDDVALFGTDENDKPVITCIPATLIGNGDIGTGWWSALTVTSGLSLYSNPYGFGICVGGRYDGYRIYNGVIYGDNEEPIAVRILGWKRSTKNSQKKQGDFEPTYTDFDLGFQNGVHMAFPYDWHGMGRPMPRIASAAIAWKDFQERDDYFQKGIKLAASKTVIHKLAEGQDAAQARGDAAQQITVIDPSGNPQTVYIETLDGGDVTYIGSGEDLAGMTFENPHPNVEEFAIRKLREQVYDLGWAWELIDLSSTGRAPTRLGCELVNNSIWQVQAIGEERMFWFTKFAIAKGIQSGRLPMPKKGNPLTEPYQWTFGYPKEMSVDAGNDVTASLSRLRFGLTSQRIESARWGHVLKQVRRHRQKEVMNLVDDAAAVVKYADEKYQQEIPFIKALEFFYQTGSAPQSLPAQPQEYDDPTPAAPAPAANPPAGNGKKPPAKKAA